MDHPPVKPKLTAVGIHVFAGLFTRGLIDAGFDVKATFEDGKFGVATHQHNFPAVKVFDDPATWPVDDYAGVDLVYSNSACSGLSLANANKGADNAANNGLNVSSQLALRLKPNAYVVESVANLFKDGDAMVKEWEVAWQAAGYRTTRIIEDAAHLGLSQRRRRALFVAVKGNFCPTYANTHAAVPTVGDAIYGLRCLPANIGEKPYDRPMDYTETHESSSYDQDLRQGSAAVTWHVSPAPSLAMRSLVPYSKPGQRLSEMSDEIMRQTYWVHKQGKKPEGRPGLLNRRLSYDAPSYTLTGGCHWIHPEFDRYITVREKARLMGVPDNFGFACRSLHDAYAEIGKAVSPIVGRWIGAQLHRALLSGDQFHVDFVDFTKPTSVHPS